MRDAQVTMAQYAEQVRGAVSVGPGIWIDGQNRVHCSIPDLLAAMGLPDTQANRDRLAEKLERILRSDAPLATLTRQRLRLD